MSATRVLAFSSSREKSSSYLEMAAPVIKDFLGERPLRIAFIPFADAGNQYDDYLAKTRDGLIELPYKIDVVKPEVAKSVIEEADVIMVGGGNTFKLLHDLYELELIDLISQRVLTGTPYIGWSAGSNIAGLTIGTTNEMPVIEPKSFKALGFFPFQINPHYVNIKPEGHNGETRDERLIEYIKVNPTATIIGLPEGTALQREGDRLQLKGNVPAALFKSDEKTLQHMRTTIEAPGDLSHLL